MDSTKLHLPMVPPGEKAELEIHFGGTQSAVLLRFHYEDDAPAGTNPLVELAIRDHEEVEYRIHEGPFALRAL